MTEPAPLIPFPDKNDLKCVEGTHWANKKKDEISHSLTIKFWTKTPVKFAEARKLNVPLLNRDEFKEAINRRVYLRLNDPHEKAGISQTYWDTLNEWYRKGESMPDNFYYGIFADKSYGTRYYDGNFVVCGIQDGMITQDSVTVYLAPESYIVLSVWETTQSNGQPFSKSASGEIRSQCRMDLCEHSRTWGTCHG